MKESNIDRSPRCEKRTRKEILHQNTERILVLGVSRLNTGYSRIKTTLMKCNTRESDEQWASLDKLNI